MPHKTPVFRYAVSRYEDGTEIVEWTGDSVVVAEQAAFSVREFRSDQDEGPKVAVIDRHQSEGQRD